MRLLHRMPSLDESEKPRRRTRKARPAGRTSFAKERSSIEILDLPDAAVPAKPDEVTPLNLHRCNVTGHLDVQPFGMRQAVDERTQIGLDGAASRRGKDPHQGRIAASGERSS